MCCFVKGFSFDTLLSIISCITGIIALIIGGIAYNHCKINKNTVKSKKNISDGGNDNSINVGGDYHQGISGSELISVMDIVKEITDTSINAKFDSMSSKFQEQQNKNLTQIMHLTQKIVSEQKLSFANYTKIDWIQIYFEAAKNTSDVYMQNVWARVLAKELSSPNSFCYKTIEVLKNMSETEFDLLKKLSTINIGPSIIKGDYLNNYNLNWVNLQKLREHELISLDNSQIEIPADPNDPNAQQLNSQYCIIFRNNSTERIENKIPCYMLTTAAIELMTIISENTDISIAKEIVLSIRKSANNNCKIELHNITRFANKDDFDYEITDIMDTSSGLTII